MLPEAFPPTRVEIVKAGIQCILYTAAGLSADALFAILRILRVVTVRRPKTDFRRLDVDVLSESELRKLVTSPPFPSTGEGSDADLVGRVHRLTKDTVGKFELDSEDPQIPSPESVTLDLIFQHTTIPVPRVRHVIRVPEEDEIVTVMDYIPGRQLRHVWPSMSLFGKLRVVLTVRDYARQLRAIRHPRSLIPGPVAPGTTPLNPLCHMMTGSLDLTRPECATYAEFSDWWNYRYAMSIEEVPEIHVGVAREPFDDTKPLVLTHCDLNMRNFLVGDDGRLYLIDWGLSGFYPEWFEYVNWRYWLLEEFGGDHARLDRTDRLWNMMIPLMTLGPYFRQERWYYRMSSVLRYIDRLL